MIYDMIYWTAVE